MAVKNSYYARLIKDLAVTFNGAALSVKDIAAYWKRSTADIQKVATKLDKVGVLKIEKNGDLKLTKNYRNYFRHNPDLALSVAANGF